MISKFLDKYIKYILEMLGTDLILSFGVTLFGFHDSASIVLLIGLIDLFIRILIEKGVVLNGRKSITGNTTDSGDSNNDTGDTNNDTGDTSNDTRNANDITGDTSNDTRDSKDNELRQYILSK